jgi:alkylation response protein AidB-like acyl-CoA dehydrogenase
MDLDLSEEQKILFKSARDFLGKESSKQFVREMREDDKGYTHNLWRQLAELGWLGVIVPEEFGGTGGSFLDLATILEAMGEACMPGPFFSTAVLGATAILMSGSEDQKKELLPKITNGELILAFAIAEPGNWYGASNIETKVERIGEAFVLNGVKHFVENAHVADKIICVAQADKGLTMFLVDRDREGVSIKPFETLGYDKHCEVVFNTVNITEESVLGEPGAAEPVLDVIEERAAVAKCAEMIGALQSSFDMTLAYAKEREQFGRPIGSFQAVQHHLSNMKVDLDSARLITNQAAWKISEGIPASMEAAMAKAFTSEASGRVTRLGHQVHGAISFCDEHDLHLYYRKVKAASVAFGDAEYHLERVAQELGLQAGSGLYSS